MIRGGADNMKKCDCYHIQSTIKYKDDCIPFMAHDGVCWGTREQDICSCGGDRTKCDFYPDVREKAFKEIEPKFGEWISVKDRLPNDCETVLVYTVEDYIFMFYYCGNNEWIGDYGEVTTTEYEDITHWMPLPKTPKGERSCRY
jgi:hypothetical protein